MSFVQLPIIEVGVADLLLDLDNYRIPTRPGDEAAALNYLYAQEEVLAAAKLILRDGYFDNEVPIVVAEQPGRYTVLEGNRRVSALKGLLAPDSVPSHAHELRLLLKRYAVEADNLPTAIRVIVANSRAEAGPHIARLHTTVPKKRWSRDQQANYYYSLLGPTTTVADLRVDYPDVDVPRFIKMVTMRRFLAGVAFDDVSLRDYVKSAALTMSAFEYAYRNTDIASAIGVRFDAGGHLEPSTAKPEDLGAKLSAQERAAVELLMVEFRAKRLNTRSPEFRKGTEEHRNLLARLAGASTNVGGSSSGSGQDPEPDAETGDPAGQHDTSGADTSASAEPVPRSDGSGGGVTGEPGAPAGARGPNHPDTKPTLSLSGLDFTTHTSLNLQRRYHELRKVPLKETPVAAALLLRSVLEVTIKYHFEGTTTPVDGKMQLANAMKIVADAYGHDKALKYSIERTRSGGTGVTGSAQWFNAVSHNAEVVVSDTHVREAFGLIEPVLRRLLRPPA